MEALAHLRVLEVGSDAACAYAGKLLAGLGAEVLKIEPPEGDALRHWGPFPCDRSDPERSGLFRYLNEGKRSGTLELASEAGRRAILDLAREADILLESGRAGELEARGLGPHALAAANPALAIVRLSPWGQAGPYREREATDLVLQAAGGWVSAHGIPGTRPVRVGGRLPEHLVGTYAAAVALTAWLAARRGAERPWVDLSALECLVATLPYPMLWAELLAQIGSPPPQKRRVPIPGVLRCKDGWVGVNCMTRQQWEDACAMFEAPEFAERQADVQAGRAEEFFERIQPWLDERTVDEIVTLGQAFRIPTVWIGNGETLPRFAQLRERGFFVRDPGEGSLWPGAPYRLSRTPVLPPRRAPRLGEHGSAFRPPRWGARPEPPPAPWSRGSPAAPFAGLRVLDLGTFWAGPYASLFLASFGADVIKVESVQRPDGFRFLQTVRELGEDFYEQSSSFQGTNHGKRGITLDLTRPRGRELFLELVRGADVVLENFSPRVLENFGLGYEALCAVRPDVILVRMPGFGLEGPWRDYVGWALVIEQATGMSWVTGHEDGPPLSPGGFVDCAVALHALIAIQAALVERARSGAGQMIELAQLETGACYTAEQVIDFSANGRVQGREGNRDRRYAPQGTYACRGEGWVALSVRSDAEWQRLVALLGSPAWATDDLAGAAARRRHHERIDRGIEEWTRGQEAAACAERLRAAGIPAARVLVAAEMYGEPQLEARGFYQEVDHPRSGKRRFPVWPFRCSFGPERPYAGPAPTLGQHNDEVLGGELGLSPAELAELRAERIIGERMAS